MGQPLVDAACSELDEARQGWLQRLAEIAKELQPGFKARPSEKRTFQNHECQFVCRDDFIRAITSASTDDRGLEDKNE